MRIYGGMRIFSKYIIYILAISISLVGCGSYNGLNALPGNNNVITQINTNIQNKELKGELELQIFIGGYGDKFWNEAMNEFQKEYPKVNVIKQMGQTINVKMTPRWMSGNPPDFAYVDGPEFPQDELVNAGMLMDLKEWFNTSKTLDGSTLIKDNLYKGFIRENDGKIYFAPYIFGTLGLWYNAKLFKENKLKIPTNFEEFLSLAPILKTKNIALMNYPGKFPGYLFQGFIRANMALLEGQQILDDIDTLKPGVFVSEAFYKSMYKLEVVSKTDNAILNGTLALNHIQSQVEWLNGKAAFIPNGLWLENEMSGSIPPDFEMAYIPSLIQDKGQKYVICAYTNRLCLASQGKNPEAAKAWLAFLYRENIMRRFTEITGIPMAYKMDLSDSNVSEKVKNVQKWIADPNISFVYEKNLDERVNKVLNTAINDVVAGKINAREACERIQKEADKVLAEKSKE